MGDDRVTIQNLRVMKVDTQANLLVIEGALPGPEQRLVLIEKSIKRPGAIVAAKEKVAICKRCFNISEGELCNFCRDGRRDSSVVCVVEEPSDIVAVERTNEFRGLYHVLGGHISPMDGVGPDDLRIRDLDQRLGDGEIKEVVVCTNPTVEGEATAIYLANLLKPLGVRVTRIASGLPVGGELEYADEVTLGRALEGRRDM
jgi:recombination protein RecR